LQRFQHVTRHERQDQQEDQAGNRLHQARAHGHQRRGDHVEQARGQPAAARELLEGEMQRQIDARQRQQHIHGADDFSQPAP
jgi:hypothetical protein